MPPSLTAATGIDALTHAIEAYICNTHTPYTDALSLEAVRLVSGSLRDAVRDGSNMDARTNMCWAEYMAGLAFSNAGLGLVHGIAHQLGGFYNIPHGLANAILLPRVLEYNRPYCMAALPPWRRLWARSAITFRSIRPRRRLLRPSAACVTM